MNQKEYELIADVIRDRKENATRSKAFGYSDREIESWLAVLNDFQDMLAYRLGKEYASFDSEKFNQACKL